MQSQEIIAPLREWLLSQRRCPGCGRPLDSQRRKRKNGVFLTTCGCQRAFTYNPRIDSYQHTLLKKV